MNELEKLKEKLLDKVTDLRDIADALRTTNLNRGRQLHKLADDFVRLLAQALVEPPDPATAPDAKVVSICGCPMCEFHVSAAEINAALAATAIKAQPAAKGEK